MMTQFILKGFSIGTVLSQCFPGASEMWLFINRILLFPVLAFQFFHLPFVVSPFVPLP